MKNKIIEKLFITLFPKRAEWLSSAWLRSGELNTENLKLECRLADESVKCYNLEKRIKELEETPKPTMADLMRDILHLPMLDFDNVDAKGQPPHPFAHLSKPDQMRKYSELRDAYKNESLQEIMTYWVNRFGNHAIRKVDPTGLETQAGVFSINGIAAIRKELAKADIAVQESREPPEDVDEQGIIPE